MPVVIDGNTHMYIMLSQNDSIYDVDVSKYVDIIKYSEGMEITLEYTMDSQLNKVVGIINNISLCYLAFHLTCFDSCLYYNTVTPQDVITDY